MGAWLRCYRCWSAALEVQVHYEGTRRIDPVTGERGEVVEEFQQAVVRCLDCMHDRRPGDHGTREFFTHVRFHQYEDDEIVVHLLIELYARSNEEAIQVLGDAARGQLTITSPAEESRPPAASRDDPH